MCSWEDVARRRRASTPKPSRQGGGWGNPVSPTPQPPLGAPGIPMNRSGGNPGFPMFTLAGHATVRNRIAGVLDPCAPLYAVSGSSHTGLERPRRSGSSLTFRDEHRSKPFEIPRLKFQIVLRVSVHRPRPSRSRLRSQCDIYPTAPPHNDTARFVGNLSFAAFRPPSSLPGWFPPLAGEGLRGGREGCALQGAFCSVESR